MRALYARRKILFALGCALAMLAGFARTIAFTARHWDEPWPEGRLAIDGNFYLAGAKQIWGAPHFWQLSDNYHSPGFQVLLGLLFRLTAPQRGIDTSGLIHATKVISLFLFVATVVLLLRLGAKVFSQAEGALAAAILSASLVWCFYTNMLQYEVLAGFLLTLAITCGLELGAPRARTRILAALAGGFSLALLSWIQSRFILLSALPFTLMAWRRTSFRTRVLECSLMLACALLPILIWIGVSSWRAGAFLPLMERVMFRFHLGNNPNSLGVDFPYPPIAEPSGWAFVKARPGDFLWLVGQRFLYFWDIKPDWWTIPKAAEPFLFHYLRSGLSFLAFLLGLGLALREKGTQPLRMPLYFVLAAVMAPPLVLFASGRFLVPLLPVVALFQARFLLAAGKTVLNCCRFPKTEI